MRGLCVAMLVIFCAAVGCEQASPNVMSGKKVTEVPLFVSKLSYGDVKLITLACKDDITLVRWEVPIVFTSQCSSLPRDVKVTFRFLDENGSVLQQDEMTILCKPGETTTAGREVRLDTKTVAPRIRSYKVDAVTN